MFVTCLNCKGIPELYTNYVLRKNSGVYSVIGWEGMCHRYTETLGSTAAHTHTSYTMGAVSTKCRLQTADCRLQTADRVQNAD